ncbi:MAG: hypothetical protein LC098_04080 [Burkholderiales bacterium]|nr:hypothetical protein [Burkholderiales bacterium]
MKRTLTILVLLLVSSFAFAKDVAVKDKTYASTKDSVFSASLAALRSLGANVQNSDAAGGTIKAQSSGGFGPFVKAADWNVTIEAQADAKVSVNVQRSTLNALGIHPDNDPKAYAEFFRALDDEVAKRAK